MRPAVALYRKGDWLRAKNSRSRVLPQQNRTNTKSCKLARQRGDLDCGGARFVLVGYGNFHWIVIDLPDGHLSVCFLLGSARLDHWEVTRDISLASG
jgi:hypothetical protein